MPIAINPESERLIAVPQVADKLGCSERTVWELVRKRKLPSRRLGSRRLVALSDVHEFIARLDRG